MSLKALDVAAGVWCPAWHARGSLPSFGAACCHCGRSIAQPESTRGMNAACIYCGWARGDVPAIEAEPPGAVERPLTHDVASAMWAAFEGGRP